MKISAFKSFAAMLILLMSMHAQALTEQQKKMLEQMDQLDQMDRMDFVDTNNSAKDCIRKRDFDCAEKKISLASKYMTSSRDKAELEQARQSLSNEKVAYANELEAARRKQLAEERARAQAAAAQQNQGSGFQWGKLAALGAGAVIGGVNKLPADTQAKLLTGMVQDSMEGQQGASNFQNAANNGSNNGSGGRGGAADEEARNRAIGLQCKSSAESARPWNDAQVDTFCMQATFDKCLADHGIMAYEPERRQVCSTLGGLLKSVGGNLSSCSGCR